MRALAALLCIFLLMILLILLFIPGVAYEWTVKRLEQVCAWGGRP